MGLLGKPTIFGNPWLGRPWEGPKQWEIDASLESLNGCGTLARCEKRHVGMVGWKGEWLGWNINRFDGSLNHLVDGVSNL